MNLDGGNISLLVRLGRLLTVQGSKGIHESLQEGALFPEVLEGDLGVLLITHRCQLLLVALFGTGAGIFGGVRALAPTVLSLPGSSG